MFIFLFFQISWLSVFVISFVNNNNEDWKICRSNSHFCIRFGSYSMHVCVCVFVWIWWSSPDWWHMIYGKIFGPIIIIIIFILSSCLSALMHRKFCANLSFTLFVRASQWSWLLIDIYYLEKKPKVTIATSIHEESMMMMKKGQLMTSICKPLGMDFCCMGSSGCCCWSWLVSI